MKSGLDADRAFKKASELRRLCLSLPHLSTPAEQRRLERFDGIVLAPGSATHHDVGAIVAGWRNWWRAQRFQDIERMASELPPDIVDRDRDLAMFAVAVRVRRER